MKKLAVIRNKETPCPFGLPIPYGCRSAGISVDKMTKIDDSASEEAKNEEEKIRSNNMKILSSVSPSQCKYANHLFNKSHKSVECSFGDSSAGQKNPLFEGSEYYSQIMNGIGFSGLYTVPPMSGPGDPFYNRNLYYGLSEYASAFSILKKIKAG